MAYCTGNPQTKKALKTWVARGHDDSGMAPRVFSPGPFPTTENGVETIEGPHYPKPHRWYARVTVRNGVIIRVIS